MIAFGGNALDPDPSRPEGQEERAAALAAGLAPILAAYQGAVLVHGNGPQVGTALLRAEATGDQLSVVPLDVLVAETQGSIGYLLARALRNSSPRLEVVTLLTQVVVDREDPGFRNPSKPVGPYYPDRKPGWEMVRIAGRGWRRVVPSPRPREVVELAAILRAVGRGRVVIAGGGGGVPVVRAGERLEGIEAVIDKDRTASLLARALRAGAFVILMDQPHVARSFGTPDEEPIRSMPVAAAREMLDSEELPPGSMGPKVEAAADYVEEVGQPALITDIDHLETAMAGRAGTLIEP
ncbi:MAG: carbamate kinase [Acidimicrobiia bacterium]